MEGQSLLKDGIQLTPEDQPDPRLLAGMGALNVLLHPIGYDPEAVLQMLDQHVADNPHFDADRVAALRVAVQKYYEAERQPVEGIAADTMISLEVALTHPGIQKKRESLGHLFKGIGPVIYATIEQITALFPE